MTERDTSESLHARNRALVEQFTRQGVAVVPGVFTKERCQNMLTFACDELERRKASGGPFGNIHESDCRYDLMLQPKGLPLESLNAACSHPLLMSTLLSLLSAAGTLVELSVLMSFPGAVAQVWHRDSKLDPESARMVTVFLPLVELEPDMGPVELQTGTCRGGDGTAAEIAMTVGAGDAILMDSTTIHRGGANTSRLRPVFYFSILSPEGTRPVGPVYSML